MNTLAAKANWDSLELAEPTGLAVIAGFLFAVRIAIVYLSVHLLGAEPRTGAALVLVLDALLLLLVCFQSLGNSSRSFGSVLHIPAVAWVFAYLSFSLCSFAWSGTVSLPDSLAYWCGLASDVAIVALLLRAGDVSVVAHAILKGFIAGACCIALVAWILPEDPLDLRLGDEEFLNANQIGNLAALAILLAQYLTRRKVGRWRLATLLLAITLLRSLSKTTIVAFLASEAFLLLRDRSIPLKAKLLTAAATVLVLAAFWGLFQAYFDIYTTTGNRAETLTGRTAIWATVLSAALEHPWLGHGFDSMWKVIPPFGPDRFEARHAENELLQQFYAYGVAGVVLLIGIYGSLMRQIRRLSRTPEKTVLLSILLYALIRGLAEAEPFDLLLPLWAVVLLSLLASEASAASALPAEPDSDSSEPVRPEAEVPAPE
jgi:exopolysaccharide production protein ExoQ